MRIFAPDFPARVIAGKFEGSICIGLPFEVRQISKPRTSILMPFASAYVLVLNLYISEHRIRFTWFYLEKAFGDA